METEINEHNAKWATICRYCDLNCGSFEEAMRHQNICRMKNETADENVDEDKVKQLLSDPRLLDRIIAELDKRIPAQHIQKKTCILALCSVFVDACQPIHILLTAESSSGKSFLMKAVSELIPADMKEYRTKISREAFTYWHNERIDPDWTWDGKVCFLEDICSDVLNSPAMKLMMSEGSVSTVVVRQRPVDIRVNGKPVVFLTTAYGIPSVELCNRLVIITLDETSEQTKRIFRIIGHELSSSEAEEFDVEIKQVFSTLKRVSVKIPFAGIIGEYFPSEHVRARRDFQRFLDFVRASAALFQFQRKKNDFGDVIANEQDYELALEVLIGLSEDGEIGLSHHEKKALKELRDICKDASYGSDGPNGQNTLSGDLNPPTPSKWLTVSDIHSKKPTRAEENWRKLLNSLSEKGFVAVDYRPRMGSSRDVAHYLLIPKSNLYQLPHLQSLLSKPSEPSPVEIQIN